MRRAVALLPLVLLAAACGGTSAPKNVDVSSTAGPQNEVWAAVDPTNPDVVVAGSNDFGVQLTRGYTSTDAGRTWKVAFAPPLASENSAAVDPTVAIDSRGREYYASLQFARSSNRPYLYASARSGPAVPWSAPVLVGRAALGGAPGVSDDKDAIAADGTRVYLAWSRFFFWTRARHQQTIELSHTSDGGRTWSTPVTVTRSSRDVPLYASVAAHDRVVAVAWQEDIENPNAGIRMAVSRDGGVHFGDPVEVGRPACHPTNWLLKAAPQTGAPPAPGIVFDTQRNRIDLAYGTFDCANHPQAHVEELDLQLHRVADHLLGRGFFAVPAYDRATGDRWACWYAMHDDIHTRYTCTVNFAEPRAVATVESDETGPKAAHGFSGREYGDYESVTAWNGVAHAFWTDSRNLATLGEEIYTATLKAWK